MKTLTASTPTDRTHVLAEWDSLEMDHLVQVSYFYLLVYNCFFRSLASTATSKMELFVLLVIRIIEYSSVKRKYFLKETCLNFVKRAKTEKANFSLEIDECSA